MTLFVELFKAKPAWLALGREAREDYVRQVGDALGQLLAGGELDIIGWGENVRDTDRRADFDWFGVYRMPDAGGARSFERIVEAAGWYHYFDQVNVSGEAVEPSSVLQRCIAL